MNVYAAKPVGYLISGPRGADLVKAGPSPGHWWSSGLATSPGPRHSPDHPGQDVREQQRLRCRDPTWKWRTNTTGPNTGDLWYPHVYMPTQNNSTTKGVPDINPFGRWDYDPWVDPANFTPNLTYPPVLNPYYDPVNAPWEEQYIPDTPNPSMVMEAYMDTPLVNGAAYPNMTVEPKAYRFRILNAANDRFWNLQLYKANKTIVTDDNRINTEVTMIPSTDPLRPDNLAGVPDPGTAGASFIQIGTEGGFLPAPAVINSTPITWDMTTGNVANHSLLLGCAERADVIVDFSKNAGETLILYNYAPAGFPAPDNRYDYYTGDPDLTSTGGHLRPRQAMAPNTRTIMQINVTAARSDNQPIVPYDLDALNATFAKTPGKSGVFEKSQDPIIVPMPSYDSAYNMTFSNQSVNNSTDPVTFTTLSGNKVTIPLQKKAIQDSMPNAYDLDYGRMIAWLGLDLPGTTSGMQNYALYPYASPRRDR